MAAKPLGIDPRRFDAVIFDLDGVVTRTAELHAAAWKQMFDQVLEERSRRHGERLRPFSLEQDYLPHVDGKPRSDGVRDFLRSRGIELPEGSPGDDPGDETVCGLGNRKNALFRQLLAQQGVQVYDRTVDLIRRLRRAGLKTAVVSASKNARTVLAAAGVEELFAARIDGVDAERLGLAGKPAPDLFLEAANRLGTHPRRAVVVEDARSGVQAGRAGGFGLVIGVDHSGQGEELAAFADLVIQDLGEIRVDSPQGDAKQLPSALEGFAELANRLQGQRPAVFLDYDGTLTPIVERPEQARLSAAMRRTVGQLAERCTVAIVSGRDRQDVEELMGLEGLVYAGSHGFDIAGPTGMETTLEQGRDHLPALDQAEAALHERLDRIEGAQVERKRFAIAIHVRRVAPERQAEVARAVEQVLEQTAGLRKTEGKMIFEFRPDLDWDKGKALRWLLENLGLDNEQVVPIYLGDDLTDEDALDEIAGDGIGILVGEAARPTRARYFLRDVGEVQSFLQRLGEWLERPPR